MIKYIYNDKILKYPLNENEILNIDNVWSFIKIFNKPFIYLSDYRDYLIKTINKKYTVDEFNFYENIANKLFWNLRWLLFYYL